MLYSKFHALLLNFLVKLEEELKQKNFSFKKVNKTDTEKWLKTFIALNKCQDQLMKVKSQKKRQRFLKMWEENYPFILNTTHHLIHFDIPQFMILELSFILVGYFLYNKKEQ